MMRYLKDLMILLAFGFLSFGFFVLWGQPSPIESYKRITDTFIVSPGEEVLINVEASRRTAGCESIIKRQWIDSASNVLETKISYGPALPAGPEKLFPVRLIVPLKAPHGLLMLRTLVEFRCNFIQRLFGGTEMNLGDISFIVAERQETQK